jgi:hypothetical protein
VVFPTAEEKRPVAWSSRFLLPNVHAWPYHIFPQKINEIKHLIKSGNQKIASGTGLAGEHETALRKRGAAPERAIFFSACPFPEVMNRGATPKKSA